jgi:hypothetical protein
MTRNQANDLKHELALRKLGAERYEHFTALGLFVVMGTMIVSGLLNARALHFFFSYGNYLPDPIVWLIAAVAAFFGASTLRDDAFETVKTLYWMRGYRPEVGTLWNNGKMFFKTRSFGMVLLMVVGIIGATLFIYDMTAKDEVIVEQAEKNEESIDDQIDKLDKQLSADTSKYNPMIRRYIELDKMKFGAIPLQTKVDSLTDIYYTRRDSLESKRKVSQQQLAAFRPTRLLSDIINKSETLRYIVCVLIGVLFSLGCIDLVQYRRINIEFSRAYDFLYLTNNSSDALLLLYNINDNGNSTDDSTVHSPVHSTVNSSVVDSWDEEDEVRNDSGYDGATSTQLKILECWVTGEKSISGIAKSTDTSRDTVRATIRKFFPSQYEKFMKNSKHTPQQYKE